jgi:hypothetical protein
MIYNPTYVPLLSDTCSKTSRDIFSACSCTPPDTAFQRWLPILDSSEFALARRKHGQGFSTLLTRGKRGGLLRSAPTAPPQHPHIRDRAVGRRTSDGGRGSRICFLQKSHCCFVEGMYNASWSYAGVFVEAKLFAFLAQEVLNTHKPHIVSRISTSASQTPIISQTPTSQR